MLKGRYKTSIEFDLIGALWLILVVSLGQMLFRWISGLLIQQGGTSESLGKALANVFH